jgi:4-hydroxy-tetrahydrodipicolinate reductase
VFLAAVSNISNCFLVNVPVISGTTGWLEQYDEMVALCTKMALSSQFKL